MAVKKGRKYTKGYFLNSTTAFLCQYVFDTRIANMKQKTLFTKVSSRFTVGLVNIQEKALLKVG